MARILIIGYGNPLRGDDGFGYLAAERLRELVRDRNTTVLAVHQLTPELMEPVSQAERVIFIDACAGPAAGELRERLVDPEAVPEARFTHHFSPEMLLAGARSLYGRAAEGVLITCAGSDFWCSGELSHACSVSLDQAIFSVLRILHDTL